MLTALIILTICAGIAFAIKPRQHAKKRNTGTIKAIPAIKYYPCKLTGLNGIQKSIQLESKL